MSPRTWFACTLCGGDVKRCPIGPPWMIHFRAVYALSQLSYSVFLSETVDSFVVEDVVTIVSSEEPGRRIPIKLMRETSRDYYYRRVPRWPDPNAWGFPFHQSCWELLEASSPTKHVNLQSLFGVCRLFPVRVGGVLDFGHDYGGLYPRANWDVFPPFPSKYYIPGMRKCDIESPIHQSYECDPLNISSLMEIIQNHDRSDECLSIPNPLFRTSTGADSFAKLPVEIAQQILMYLTSTEVLNLKLSSHAIANIPLHDRFWHSRFCPGHEFAYIFEFADYSDYNKQWRKVYMAVRRTYNQPSLRNRRRIWDLAIDLHKLCSKFEAAPENSRMSLESLDIYPSASIRRTSRIPLGHFPRYR
ncbi:hypothetical protein GGS21DRAFT_513356 [Xylaria nigripes]|nr:hypothetical protein GGS21DRAFT_513356 [Xylaria nigripes]